MFAKIHSLDDLQLKEKEGALEGLFDVPEDLYHQGPGISSTDLKHLLRSPAHYKAAKEDPFEDSAALRLGRAIHCAVLEPAKFEAFYKPAEKVDSRTTYGKTVVEARRKEVGVTWLPVEERARVLRIRDSVLNNEKIKRCFHEDSRTEVSCYWRDEETNVLCKARADLLSNLIIYDLKTTEDATETAFLRAIINYKYHLSAAWYIEGFSRFGYKNLFGWFAVEKDPPYATKIYTPSQEMLETGLIEAKNALITYAECVTTGVWPAYENSVIQLNLPSYYKGTF